MPPRSVLSTALLAVSVVVLAPAAVWAQVNVGNEAELRTAIFNANTGGDTTINLLNDITLTQSLPMISSNITFDGGGYTIDAAGAGRVFFIESGTVSIANVEIENAVAQGGNGGSGEGGGGGGGLGAGAALFVYAGANVTVTNVLVSSAAANGGNGGAAVAGVGAGGGGGGGLGGNGGSGTAVGGGGGGYAGAGGAAPSTGFGGGRR